MRLERLLQVHLAALAALSTLLLSVGQRDALVPALALAGAALSVCLTDAWGVLRLHRAVANLAAVAALAISLRAFVNTDAGSRQQLFAIANLLVYLQFVLLFQRKTERIYWQLLTLSLLQVVVAAALRQEALFGVLLGVYLILALSALTLFHLHAAGAGQPFEGLLGLRWLRLLGTMSVTVVAVAALFFVAAPRRAALAWHSGMPKTQARTRFAEQIRVGDEQGEIRLSKALAMRAAFFDPQTGDPLRLEEGPYLRGTTLTVYHPIHHVWQVDAQQARQPLAPPPAIPAESPYVRQEIALAPIETATLFGMEPFYRLPETPRSTLFAPEPQRLVRDLQQSNPLQSELRYTLATTGILEGRQFPLVPHGNAAKTFDEQWQMRREWEELTDFDDRQLAPLRQLADDTLARAQITANEPYAAALALASHLRDSGQFHYTLDFRSLPPCPPGVDPTVHFAVDQRQGHCEVYASALALMLRSQGIPSRLVSGYYGGEHNELGGYYRLRQSDAHAWVEAWLLPQQIPAELRETLPLTAAGAWLRLDPTPPDPADLPASTLQQRAERAWDHFELLWGEYVLGLNSQRQRTGIYGPMRDWLTRQLAAVRAWSNLRQGVEQVWQSQRLAVGKAQPFLWIPLAASLLVAAALILIARRLIRQYRRLNAPAAASGQAPAERAAMSSLQETVAAQFREAEQLLQRRLRLSRRLDQTPSEFIADAVDRLPSGSSASAILQRLTAAYHKARFGLADSASSAMISHLVRELAAALTDADAAACDQARSDPARSASK